MDLYDINYELQQIGEKLDNQSMQLDFLNQTLAVLTTYMLYAVVLLGFIACLLACLVGFKIARGR